MTDVTDRARSLRLRRMQLINALVLLGLMIANLVVYWKQRALTEKYRQVAVEAMATVDRTSATNRSLLETIGIYQRICPSGGPI